MGGGWTWVRAVAAAFVLCLAVVGGSAAAPASVTVPVPASVTAPGTPSPAVGVVTGPTGACTCAGGGFFQPGSENESRPHP